jgi:hypothetical protein
VTVALVLLLLAALAPVLVLLLRRLLDDPTVLLAAVIGALLAAAAVVAGFADGDDGWRRGAALVLGVTAATTGGSDVVRATFRVIRGELLPRPRRRADVPDDDSPVELEPQPTVLRGGAWVGYLERAAISATLLAGWPEGMALALAVKGVGRYPELRGPESVQTHAPETFIIGTLASVLWAAACAGTARLVVS